VPLDHKIVGYGGQLRYRAVRHPWSRLSRWIMDAASCHTARHVNVRTPHSADNGVHAMAWSPRLQSTLMVTVIKSLFSQSCQPEDGPRAMAAVCTLARRVITLLSADLCITQHS